MSAMEVSSSNPLAMCRKSNRKNDTALVSNMRGKRVRQFPQGICRLDFDRSAGGSIFLQLIVVGWRAQFFDPLGGVFLSRAHASYDARRIGNYAKARVVPLVSNNGTRYV